MSTTQKILRFVSAILLAGCASAAFAQTTFTSNSPFVAVGSTAAAKSATTTATDPEAYGYAPTAPDMNYAYSPYAGTQLSLGSAGPQVQITHVKLYAYALRTIAYQRISARFRFWNAYQASASPVFSKPIEFVVQMATCPCNFVAGNAYSVEFDLPKPVYTESLSVGFSQVWEVDTGDQVLAVSSDLVPAFDTAGGTPSTGAAGLAYANLGRSPDDLNFAPADAAADPATKLGVALYGTPMTLDQCTGAANFQTQFDEEFDDAGAFYQRWKANPNSGTFTVGSGYLALSAPDNATQFPYIASGAQSTVIPPAGNFEVIWLAVYTDTGPSGDGEMVLSNGTPLNGNSGTLYSGNVLRSWQDKNAFSVFASTGSGVQTTGGGDGTNLRLMQYCWVNGNVEVWENGHQYLPPETSPPPPPVPAPAQRPDSIWFGNSVVAGGGGPWNPVTIYRVLVRGDQTQITDHIFSDGFGPPPGNQ